MKIFEYLTNPTFYHGRYRPVVGRTSLRVGPVVMLRTVDLDEEEEDLSA